MPTKKDIQNLKLSNNEHMAAVWDYEEQIGSS